MELTIDTASPLASIALSNAGELRAETTWLAGRGHAAELLPRIDALLSSAAVERSDVGVIFVNRGPGGYAGLRVGISTALALAFALECDLLGFGRLEADAYPFLSLGVPVCAVHDAGRGEYAWAVYERAGDNLGERIAPRIGAQDDLLASLPPGTGLAGEVRDALAALAAERSLVVVSGAAALRRAGAGAALAWPRYAAGARDSRLALTPLYLREPNITPSRRSTMGHGPTR